MRHQTCPTRRLTVKPRKTPKTRTIYLTKYALTVGIVKFEVEELEGELCLVIGKPGDPPTYYLSSEWEPTKKEAVVKAILMRDKKIDSLKKKIAELEVMTF
jgi:hypothetical protein